jgi:hypothetical protein
MEFEPRETTRFLESGDCFNFRLGQLDPALDDFTRIARTVSVFMCERYDMLRLASARGKPPLRSLKLGRIGVQRM